jgi:hypothetical protein
MAEPAATKTGRRIQSIEAIACTSPFIGLKRLNL